MDGGCGYGWWVVGVGVCVGDTSFADSCISAKVSVVSYMHRNDSLLIARAVADYYRLTDSGTVFRAVSCSSAMVSLTVHWL